MANNGQKINPEIQQAFGPLVNHQSVAEDSLKLADFVPARRCLLVEPLPRDATTKGGLVIPEQAQTDKSVGIVRSVNPADGEEYRPGDLIYFRFGAGQQIRIEGREVVVLQYFQDMFGDILGHWPADRVQLVEQPPASTPA